MWMIYRTLLNLIIFLHTNFQCVICILFIIIYIMLYSLQYLTESLSLVLFGRDKFSGDVREICVSTYLPFFNPILI